MVRERAETLFAEVRVHCAGCGRDELVAFSCKGRAVCPSCVGRRMSDTAARLVDARLPVAPYRQWVFSFPRRIRVALAKDTALWSEVLCVCIHKVFAYQRKKARTRGIRAPKTLAACFVQLLRAVVRSGARPRPTARARSDRQRRRR